MRQMYVALCRKFCPCGLTLSALAWRRAQETGDTWWRDRIDGWFLFWRSQHNHCQSDFQRRTRGDE